ncbi:MULTISPECIES: TnsA-like heteromeric transposase endonuclease subunit [unclassified Streptomyces]|uniref:TnsA-like heteromeric transposase endonuclease subunit n=1 Tax=unclassified Streptomyces TaxID=2593676 RepID=UPI0035D80693
MVDVAATVSVRRQNGQVVEDRLWGTEPIKSLASAMPWRTFRWYKGQKHYSGTYWSATMRDHVIYESRLELSRLLFADFDPSVRGIVAQPFLLKTVLEGKVRRHIPDYLLLTRQVSVVVDVKPLHRLSKPEWRSPSAGLGGRSNHGGGRTRSGASLRLWNWRTSGSWRAIEGTGCSAPKFWKTFGELSSMVSLWGRPRAVCRIVRSLKSAPPSIICSGRGLSLPISIGH